MMTKTVRSRIFRWSVVGLLLTGLCGVRPDQLVYADNGTSRVSNATDVGGLIDTNTTWTLAGSPYIAVSPVLVMAGVTLTIEPGVTVKFNSHKALKIDGELHAVGTSDSPITFTSNITSPQAGDWDYILFTDTSADAVYDINGDYESGSIIKYAVIEYAGGASVTDNASLRLDAAAPSITYTTVRNSAVGGIRGFNGPGTLKLLYNTVTDNTGVGISVSNEARFTEISDSTVTNNNNSAGSWTDGGGIYVEGWSGGSSVIKNNTIQGNTAKYNGSGLLIVGSITTVENNLVTGNSISYCPSCWDRGSIAVVHCDATVTGNTVTNNINGGIYIEGVTADILNNIVSYNDGIGVVIDWGGRIISHNIITDNTTLADASGIRVAGGYPTITFNSILRNTAMNNAALYLNYSSYGEGNVAANTLMDNVSTEVSNPRTVYIHNGNPPFNSNNIYRNNGYALYNNNPQGSATLNAENTWWGTASSTAIQALIYDWFDDSNKSIVDYSPYLTGINTDAPVSPPIGIVVTPSLSTINVVWTANPESDLAGYKVYWDTDANYPYANSADVGNITSYDIPGLSPGTDYYIAVTAYDSALDGINDMTDGNESWFSLEKTPRLLQPPGAFNKSAPSNGANDQSTSPTLTWGTSSDAVSYEYCYDTSNDNACSNWSDNGTSTSKILNGLTSNTTYYWHVRAVNAIGTSFSNGSETAFWSFTAALNPPGAFSKSSPDNGTTDQAVLLNLTWNVSQDVTGYEYCVDTSNDNDCAVWTSNGIATSVALSGLTPAVTYYWHVRAINPDGTTYSNDSETAFWSFTTAPLKLTKSIRSTGAQDGWILESAENSNIGGAINTIAGTLSLGDNNQKKQYRSILSFATASLPDNAVITKVTLRVKKQGILGGGNPVTMFQGFMVDIRKGFFGASAGLQISDFQAKTTTGYKTYGPYKPPLVNSWYALDLTSAKAYVNKLATNGGLTQIRLRFKLDDNNNAIANILNLVSGNSAVAANRPTLIIEYTLP